MSLFGTLGFSGSKNKSKSTSTGTTSSTSTPIVPEWLQGVTEGLVKKRTDLGAANPQDYVAGSNGLLDLGAQGASRLTTSPNYGTATGAASGVTDMSWLDPLMNGGAPDLSATMQRFKNPYQRDVIDASLADYDFGAGQTRAQQDLDQAGSSGFQGSGMALTRSATEDALTRGRGSLSAGLNQQGWKDQLEAALAQENLSMSDRGQKAGFGFSRGNQNLAAADTLRGIGDSEGASTRANNSQMIDIGQIFRGIEQDQRGASLNLADWAQQMPDWLTALIGTSETGTQNTTSTGKSSGLSFGLGGGSK